MKRRQIFCRFFVCLFPTPSLPRSSSPKLFCTHTRHKRRLFACFLCFSFYFRSILNSNNMGNNLSNNKKSNNNNSTNKVNEQALFPSKPRAMFGRRGDGRREFDWPYGIDYDGSNNTIVVSEYNNHRLQVFDSKGRFVSSFGTEGSKHGQFYCPGQVSIQRSTHHVVVADSWNYRAQILNEQGRFVAVIGEGVLYMPYALSCSDSPQRHNHIVAADYDNQIHLFCPASSSSSSDYKLLRSFCSHGSKQQQINYIYGLCFDDERNTIIACDNSNKRLSVWSADGRFIKTINMPSSSPQYTPLSVCVDRYANSYRFLVGTAQSQILIFDSRNDKKLLQTIGSRGVQPGQFGDWIDGVCINELDGSLLVTDTVNHRIQIF